LGSSNLKDEQLLLKNQYGKRKDVLKDNNTVLDFIQSCLYFFSFSELSLLYVE
jgi:hypothetical protein